MYLGAVYFVRTFGSLVFFIHVVEFGVYVKSAGVVDFGNKIGVTPGPALFYQFC